MPVGLPYWHHLPPFCYCCNHEIAECHYTTFLNDNKISTQDGPNDLK